MKIGYYAWGFGDQEFGYEPHAGFPQLPVFEERIPRLHAVGGPGSAK